MAEIGGGAGSSYPSAIDTDTTPETNAMYARIAVPNDLADAVVKIEAELGITPSGSFSTVVARLNALSGMGAYASRPAAAAAPGGFYFSSDEGFLEYSDGTAWYPIPLGGDA